MNVPAWYSLALLSLAAWRTFNLFAYDKIFDAPRRRLLRLGDEWIEGGRVPDEYRLSWAIFLTCPYCAGFWIGIAWFGAWQINGLWTEIVALPLAINAIVVALARVLTPED